MLAKGRLTAFTAFLLDSLEVLEGCGSLVVLDAVVIEGDPGEEGVVEQTSDAVFRAQVQIGWIIQQVEVPPEEVGSLL